MNGLNRLLQLPVEIKGKINKEFGSIQNLYQKVFDLNAEEYTLTGSKSPRLKQIQQEIYDIEDRLEDFGLTDGSDLTIEISSDFGEIIVNKEISKLNEYLAQFGTDFDTMRKWFKDKYEI